jgi:hypothetical protein
MSTGILPILKIKRFTTVLFIRVLANQYFLFRLQVDRNLALYLPRLAVLVTIEADRPGAWFPGPLGQYLTFLPAIWLSRNFNRAKVPGTPMKSPFLFWRLLGGHIQKKTIFASRQPNHVKNLLSGPKKLLKVNFRVLGSAPGDPRGACCSHFSIQKSPPDFGFLSVDRNQRQGLIEA